MALVALKRFRMDRERAARHGEEVTFKLTAKEKAELIELGLVSERVGEEEAAAAADYQKRVAKSEAEVEKANDKVAAAERAIQDAKSKEATEKAESALERAQSELAELEKAHKVLVG